MKSPVKCPGQPQDQRTDEPSRRRPVAGMAALAVASASLPGRHDSRCRRGSPWRRAARTRPQIPRLEEALAAADAAAVAAAESYKKAEPVPRDVMRHRIQDYLGGFRLPVGRDTRSISLNPKLSALYSEDEIAQLQDWPADRHPDERARVEEILVEWDRWNEECDALADPRS